MSDVDYRTRTGWVVFPKDTSAYPYTRKAGDNTVKTYLFSVASMNGADRLIRLDFWNDVPDEVVDKAALMVSGKYDIYDPGDGSDPRHTISVNKLIPLGNNVMPERTGGGPSRAPAKKRPAPVTAELDDLFDI